MLKRILFLDDEHRRFTEFWQAFEQPGVELKWVQTVKEAIHELSTSAWNEVYLDHDLGGETYVTRTETTGYEVALWMVQNRSLVLGDPLVVVHSWNPAGSDRMVQALKSSYLVVQSPFSINEWSRRT